MNIDTEAFIEYEFDDYSKIYFRLFYGYPDGSRPYYDYRNESREENHFYASQFNTIINVKPWSWHTYTFDLFVYYRIKDTGDYYIKGYYKTTLPGGNGYYEQVSSNGFHIRVIKK